jgi:hypothetical protein
MHLVPQGLIILDDPASLRHYLAHAPRVHFPSLRLVWSIQVHFHIESRLQGVSVMGARHHFVCMGAVHKLVGNEERELQEVHLNVTVKAEGQDNEWEERCDVIRWAQCAISETKHAGLDCNVSRKSASFELQEVATIRSATLWENDDGGIFSSFFNCLLSFYDLTNYLVSFFFRSSSCNKNTAQTFT